jgi:hypothetical protein
MYLHTITTSTPIYNERTVIPSMLLVKPRLCGGAHNCVILRTVLSDDPTNRMIFAGMTMPTRMDKARIFLTGVPPWR